MASTKEQIFNRTRLSRQKQTEESIFSRTFARFYHFSYILVISKVSASEVGVVETISNILENSRKQSKLLQKFVRNSRFIFSQVQGIVHVFNFPIH